MRRVRRPWECNLHNRLDGYGRGFERLARVAMSGKDFTEVGHPGPNISATRGEKLTAHLMSNIYECGYEDGAWEYRHRMLPRWIWWVLDFFGGWTHWIKGWRGTILETQENHDAARRLPRNEQEEST